MAIKKNRVLMQPNDYFRLASDCRLMAKPYFRGKAKPKAKGPKPKLQGQRYLMIPVRLADTLAKRGEGLGRTVPVLREYRKHLQLDGMRAIRERLRERSIDAPTRHLTKRKRWRRNASELRKPRPSN